VKAKILAALLAGCFGGALQASTVISCAWTTSALNTCLAGGLTNFQTQLDWAAFGTPDSTVHSTLWTSNMGGLNVTVSEQNAGVGEGARSAYDFGSVKFAGTWYDANTAPVSSPFNFVGHFNSITDSQPSSPTPPDSPYGDHLMGFAGNGVANANKALVLDFGTNGVSNIGFRIAAVSTVSFNATLVLYSGANGTGSVLGSYTSGTLGGGGTCSSLVSVAGSAPVPCNDALMLMATGFAGVQSVLVKTNDANGFYIGDIFLTDSALTSVPEPTPFVFAGCGLLLLILGKKRWGRA
jgi:hypothetical protein